MVTPIPTPINAVTASVATWQPARAGTTAFNPFDAPIAAKNALPGPGLYASGNRKTTNATADSTVMWRRIYGLDTAAGTSGTRDDERDTGEHALAAGMCASFILLGVSGVAVDMIVFSLFG